MTPTRKIPFMLIYGTMATAGAVAFIAGVLGGHPQKAWLAYLSSFLVFSALAQGGLLFSTMMHVTRARWSAPLSNLAESFAAFFPVSFVLFLFLFAGKAHLFPWIGEDLHGKEAWLNLPFLFFRDMTGLILLYGFGFLYLYYSLWFKLKKAGKKGRLHGILTKRWGAVSPDPDTYERRKTLFALLYMFFFAIILSLIGYDLVMSMDPHWYSTLFGAYSFMKAIYSGFGALIILAAAVHLSPRTGLHITSSQFHDIGKLFFAFCLVWSDFFYSQLVVIWYGNISEETAYLIERTMNTPWRSMAWTVFIVCFISPFLILLSKRVKTMPKAMLALCTAVVTGIWIEHYLLLGPIYLHHASESPIGISDMLIAMGFFGLLAAAVTFYLREFPELFSTGEKEVN